MSSNADAIVKALGDAGVEQAFGLPGGEVTPLIEACRYGRIRFFLTGHEASAAFMAEVTGQITGRPGVCIATLGPGAMNLCLGVANAFLDRCPVVAITADLPAAVRDHFPHQRLSLTEVFTHITKQSIVIDGDSAEEQVRAAVDLAVAPRPGPVHIAVPSDLAGQPARHSVALSERIAAGTHSHGDGVAEVATLLAAAHCPLLLLGLGCAPQDAPALRHFVAQTGIPFVVTPKAKGLLPEDMPQFLGVVGGVAADGPVMETVDHADVLLGVGFDPVECDKDWYVRKQIVNLDRAPTTEGTYQPTEVLGDIGRHLQYLSARVTSPLRWSDDLLAARRAAVRALPVAMTDARARVSPRAVIEALRDVLPRDAILATDVGSHKYYAAQYWVTYEPHTFFISNGLSAMGYGVPAAIAAKLAFPSRTVAAVVGDGGMLMMLHNLTFIQQYKVPVVIVVLVDESLSLIRIGQERRGFQPYGVDFPAPDFAKLGDGFGVAGTTATTVDALKRVVEEAVETRTARIVHVPIDIREYYDFV